MNFTPERKDREQLVFWVNINKKNVFVTGHAAQNYMEFCRRYKGRIPSEIEAKQYLAKLVLESEPQDLIVGTKDRGHTLLLIPGTAEHLVINLDETQTDNRGDRSTISVITFISRRRNRFFIKNIDSPTTIEDLDAKADNFDFDFMERNRS